MTYLYFLQLYELTPFYKCSEYSKIFHDFLWSTTDKKMQKRIEDVWND